MSYQLDVKILFQYVCLYHGIDVYLQATILFRRG